MLNTTESYISVRSKQKIRQLRYDNNDSGTQDQDQQDEQRPQPATSKRLEAVLLLQSTTEDETETEPEADGEAEVKSSPRGRRRSRSTTPRSKKTTGNFLKDQSQKLYSRQQYVKRLRVDVRLVLPSGKPNLFFETACRLILLRREVQDFRQRSRDRAYYFPSPSSANRSPFRQTKAISFARRWKQEHDVVGRNVYNLEEPEKAPPERRQKKGKQVQVVEPDLFLKLACFSSNQNVINCYSCYLKTTDLGARIDLRTIMGALLDPTTNRRVMRSSQESRTIFYNVRIAGILIEAYRNIYLILANALLRKMLDGKWLSVKNDDDPQTKRKAKYQRRHKMTLGRLMEEAFKSALERQLKQLHRIDTSEYEAILDQELENGGEGEENGRDFDEMSRLSNGSRTTATSFSSFIATK